MTQRDDREPEAPVVAVVLAAGFGTRFDPDNPKQLVSVDDKPIVCWSIEAFEQNPHVTDTIVVVTRRCAMKWNAWSMRPATRRCA